MKESTWAYLMGFVVGIMLTCAVAMGPWSILGTAHDLKNECEQNIPRNQTCVMQYVPN